MGAPALVFVSLAPVADRAGAASVLVWPLSALIGLVMAVVFAELASMFPHRSGGIAVYASEALRPSHPFLGLLAQWSYWLGWSPAMAIGAALLGGYVHSEVAPGSSPWVAWAIAVGVLGTSVAVNHFGVRTCGRLQVLLVAAVLGPVLVLAALPLVRGDVDPGQLTPLAPPGGWSSWGGVEALLGAFFLAGWSAYAAEIALTYAPEYRGGARTARRSLFATGVLMVVVYTVVPLTLTATVGVESTAADPDETMALLATADDPLVANAVIGLALVALLLGLNMIAAADSRVLYQMARNGDAWPILGRLNRHGAPGNALVFDAAANAALLALALAVTGGTVSAVPITLLTAASVGYLISLVLALAATAMLRRSRPAAERSFRAPRGVLGLGLAAAAFNCVLVAAAGTVWGWWNVCLGASVLTVVVVLLSSPARVRAIATDWIAASSARTHARHARASSNGVGKRAGMR